MRGAVVLLACLGLAACDGRPPAPDAAPSPTPTPVIRTLESAVDLEQFDGLQARHTMSTELSGGRTRGVLSVTPDGGLVTVLSGPRTPGPDPRGPQSQLELLGPGDGGTGIPGEDGPRPRQAVYADSDDRFVVWLETPSTQVGATEWVLLAYDRQTHRTQAIDRERSVRDLTANAPTLAAGRVWWSMLEFTGDEDGPATTNLYSHSLTGQEPARLEVTRIADAAVTDDAVFYVPSDTSGRATIYRRDLVTSSESVVDTVDLGPGGTLHSLSAAGEDLAWVVRHNDRDAGTTSRVMLRQADGARTTVEGGARSLAVDAFTPDLLAWTDGGDNGGEWILDRHHDRIVRLGTQPGLAEIKATGARVAWRDGRSAWQVAELS
jgi:hypothetical protein